MSKRWEDEDDFESAGDNEQQEENEFWMEFSNAANLIEINQQQNFDIVHKQLNIELMEKAIKINKSRWIWWLFSSQKTRMKSITTTYRILVSSVHKSL